MNEVITICGSMKFKTEMINIATELKLLSQLHYKKIEISDAIYVVNINGYIGNSTKQEILYAKTLNKKILSLEPLSLE